MYIKLPCPTCKGMGQFYITLPEIQDIDCPNCIDGYIRQEIECPEIADVVNKCEEIKTKLNRMDADINYIKAKVG